MRRTRRVLGLIPPFVAGVAGAVALESSAAMLLYSDEGLLPALTLILTVEVGALGLGLLSGPIPVGGGAVEQVRRRWLFSLVAFAVAAALSAGFAIMGDLPRGGLGQGMGLAFLGSLPLFSIGSLLGAMGRPDELPSPPVATVGGPAVLGAGAGFLLVGSVLLPNVAFHSLYLFCLVVLSGGALLQGWVLDARPAIEILGSVWTDRGEVRVEERLLGTPRREVRILLEAGRLRGAEDVEGEPARGWERAVLAAIEGEGADPGPLLYLGGGSGTLARRASKGMSEDGIEIVEASRELVEMARAHFHTWDAPEDMAVEYHDLLNMEDRSTGWARTILIDCGALPLFGGMPVLEEDHWRAFRRVLAPEGRLVMGGLRLPEGREGRRLEALVRSGRKWFGSGEVYFGGEVDAGSALLPGEERGVETILVFRRPTAPDWSSHLPGFRLKVTAEE